MEQNDAESAKWHRKAAEQGEAKSQFFLSLYNNKGIGLEKDLAESVKWSRKAAEQNDPGGQLLLGNCYRKGEGVKQDYVEAYAWYSMAAKADEAAARGRDLLETMMSPQQVADAWRRAQELRTERDNRQKKTKGVRR